MLKLSNGDFFVLDNKPYLARKNELRTSKKDKREELQELHYDTQAVSVSTIYDVRNRKDVTKITPGEAKTFKDSELVDIEVLTREQLISRFNVYVDDTPKTDAQLSKENTMMNKMLEDTTADFKREKANAEKYEQSYNELMMSYDKLTITNGILKNDIDTLKNKLIELGFDLKTLDPFLSDYTPDAEEL